MEINKRLQISGDELVEYKDRQHYDEADEPDGQQREIDPVPALPTLGQPVDDHTQAEQREHDPIVGQDVRDGRHVPVPANAVDHRLGGVPGSFIGHCRVQIGTRTEKQTCERYEHEGHQYIPTEIQPVDIPVGPNGRVNATNQGAGEEDSRPYGEDHQHRTGPEPVAREKRAENDERDQTPQPLLEMPPNFEPQDAETVQTAPNHEVPRRAVPQAAQ